MGAYRWDGSDDRIVVAHGTALNLDVWTISAWVKLFAHGEGDYRIVNKAAGLNAGCLQFTGLAGTSGQLRARQIASGGGQPMVSHSVSNVLTTGSWLNVWGEYESDGTPPNLYKYDGVDSVDLLALSSSSGDAPTTVFNTDPLYIGNTTTLDATFSGWIAYVAIWDSILTAGEKLAYAEGDVGGFPDPLFWWRLDADGSGIAVNDGTVAGFDGTITGCTWDTGETPPVTYSTGGTHYDDTGREIIVVSGVVAQSFLRAAEQGRAVAAAAQLDAADLHVYSPVVDAGADADGTVGVEFGPRAVVVLDAGGATVIDTSWAILDKPTGSAVGSAFADPLVFTPDLPGDYTIRAQALTQDAQGDFRGGTDLFVLSVVPAAQHYEELDLPVTGAATLAADDAVAAVEPDLPVDAAAALTAAAVQRAVEVLELPAAATLTSSDALSGAAHYDETGRGVAAVASIAAAETLSAVEEASVAAAVSLTAAAAWSGDEGARLVAAAAAIVVEDQLQQAGHYEELGRAVAALAQIAAADTFRGVSVAALAAGATVVAEDAVAGVELDRPVAAVATSTTADALTIVEAGAIAVAAAVTVASRMTGREPAGVFAAAVLAAMSAGGFVSPTSLAAAAILTSADVLGGLNLRDATIDAVVAPSPWDASLAERTAWLATLVASPWTARVEDT